MVVGIFPKHRDTQELSADTLPEPDLGSEAQRQTFLRSRAGRIALRGAIGFGTAVVLGAGAMLIGRSGQSLPNGAAAPTMSFDTLISDPPYSDFATPSQAPSSEPTETRPPEVAPGIDAIAPAPLVQAVFKAPDGSIQQISPVATTEIQDACPDAENYCPLLDPLLVYPPGTDASKVKAKHSIAKTQAEAQTVFVVTDFGEPHTTDDADPNTAETQAPTVFAMHTSVFNLYLSGNFLKNVSPNSTLTATNIHHDTLSYVSKQGATTFNQNDNGLQKLIDTTPKTSLIAITCSSDSGAKDTKTAVIYDLVKATAYVPLAPAVPVPPQRTNIPTNIPK